MSIEETAVKVDAELERLGLSWLPAKGDKVRIRATQRPRSDWFDFGVATGHTSVLYGRLCVGVRFESGPEGMCALDALEPR